MMQITLLSLIGGLLARFVLMVILLGSALAINEAINISQALPGRKQRKKRIYPWSMFGALCVSFLLSVPLIISDYFHAKPGLDFANITLGIDGAGIISWAIIFAAWAWALYILAYDFCKTRRILNESINFKSRKNSVKMAEVQRNLHYLKSRSRLFFIYGREKCSQALEESKVMQKILIEQDNEKKAISLLQNGQLEKSLQFLLKAKAPFEVSALIAGECGNWKESCNLVAVLKPGPNRDEIAESIAYCCGVTAFRDLGEKSIKGKGAKRRQAFLLWRRNETAQARTLLKDDRDACDWLQDR